MSTELLEKRTELLEKKAEEFEARLQRIETKIHRKRKFGVPLEEVKASINNPVELTIEEIEQAKKIVGTWEGPEDLSENFRDYILGIKQEEL